MNGPYWHLHCLGPLPPWPAVCVAEKTGTISPRRSTALHLFTQSASSPGRSPERSDTASVRATNTAKPANAARPVWRRRVRAGSIVLVLRVPFHQARSAALERKEYWLAREPSSTSGRKWPVSDGDALLGRAKILCAHAAGLQLRVRPHCPFTPMRRSAGCMQSHPT